MILSVQKYNILLEWQSVYRKNFTLYNKPLFINTLYINITFLSRWTNSSNRPTVGPAKGVVQVAILKTDDELEAFDAIGHVLVKGARPIGT